MKILIHEMRSRRGLTLRMLEQLSGISRATLNSYENELTSPTLAALEQIAIALECHITDLFDSDQK